MKTLRQSTLAIAVSICIAAAGLAVTLITGVEARPQSSADLERSPTHTGTASGPSFTLESATISKGGGVLPDGSVFVIGQPVVGTMSNENFTMEVGIVAVIAAGASCPASSEPIAELIGAEVSTKNRFLSFTAGDASSTQGIRVTFDSLPPPYDPWNGAELWVGPTSQVTEAGANVVPTEGFPNFTAARLRCTPFFTDWSAEGTVHVFHEGIVPGGTYRVDVIDETCDAGVATNFSEPLPMTTAVWGDTVLDLSDTPPPPPNGPPVDIVDVLAVLERFSSVTGAIIKARADLEPACLDLRINVTDVLASIAGFTGLTYPFTPTAADPCDSTCPNVLP